MQGRRPGFRQSLPFLLAAAAILLALAGLGERWTGPDLPFRLRHLKVIPSADHGSAELDPLRAGDQILALDGRLQVRDQPALGLLSARARRGPVPVELRRGSQRLSLLLSYPDASLARRFRWTLRTLAALLVFGIGSFVIRRRRDPLSRLFFLLTLLLGSLLALDPRLSPGPMARLLELKSDFIALFLPPAWLHFLLLFPERRARPLWLRLLIYLPPSALVLVVAGAIWRNLPLAGTDAGGLVLQQLAGALSAAYLIAGLVVLVFKAFRRKRRRERRRLRLVLLASLIGILPLVAFLLLHQALPDRHLGLSVWTPLLLTLLPLSFAQGILRPDLPALNRNAAQLRRLFVTAGLLALLFLLIRIGLHHLLGGSEGLLENLVLDVIALSAALVSLRPLRNIMLSRREEREFQPFRDSLLWLAPPRYFTSRRELARALLPRLGWDAQAAWCLWLERQDGGGWLVKERWQREGGPARSITVPEPDTLYPLPLGLERSLLGDRPFLAAEQWDPYWARSMLGDGALPYCKERDWALLLCLARDSEAPVLLVCGPSEEGALYPPELIDGLLSLHSTLELHLRNLSLLARAARDEQLRTEIELARSIQLSLLPRSTPSLDGLELACRVRTSSRVGGDYYDMIEFDADRLGLAIGDATGHGVPAALLISTVASAFHGQAAGARRPAEVLAALNRGLYQLVSDRSMQPGAFAGFAYGLYDRDSGLLSYCNGGMPPPWLLRASGELERLNRGGHLLGFAEHHRYRQGVLKLHAGDLLFLRSDGLEDQSDAADNPYGEQRLLDWLQERKDSDLEALSDQLLDAVDAHAGGEQNDDISFVFMRVCA